MKLAGVLLALLSLTACEEDKPLYTSIALRHVKIISCTDRTTDYAASTDVLSDSGVLWHFRFDNAPSCYVWKDGGLWTLNLAQFRDDQFNPKFQSAERDK